MRLSNAVNESLEEYITSSYNECRKKAKELHVENNYDDIHPKYTYYVSNVDFTFISDYPFHDVREPR